MVSWTERQKQLDRQRIGTKGVVDIFLREVKFNDQEKIDESESIPQRCFHRSRTKVGGSKTIRYRRSLNHKRCRLGIGWRKAVVSGLTVLCCWFVHDGTSKRSMWCFGTLCVDRIDSSRTLREIKKLMGFGGSMVARQKLKGIDGRAHQEWSVRLNLTQHGETYQGQIARGLTD